jgi:hypothetical protein
MSVLYLHEAFHHKVESLAIRYEIVERKRRYLPYHARVVIPLLRQGSPQVLDEALACRTSCSRKLDRDRSRCLQTVNRSHLGCSILSLAL